MLRRQIDLGARDSHDHAPVSGDRQPEVLGSLGIVEDPLGAGAGLAARIINQGRLMTTRTLPIDISQKSLQHFGILSESGRPRHT